MDIRHLIGKLMNSFMSFCYRLHTIYGVTCECVIDRFEDRAGEAGAALRVSTFWHLSIRIAVVVER
jgi:hypothetical protein